MHVYLPDLAERSVPRYTSYPTAAEFHDGVGALEQHAALAQFGRNDAVALYVHVPYCREICWYCGCNTGALGRESRLDSYLDAIEQEIALVAPLQARVASVHFGGGSPNVLSREQLLRLTHRLRASFQFTQDATWAIELDPRLFADNSAEALAAAGFTRASLGAQTFSSSIQAAINRIQPFRTVARAAAELRAAGINQVNLDLMYGLPEQTLDDVAQTVSRALTLAPDRVAMFGYAHLPGMLPRQRMIDATKLPEAPARFWQSALAHDLFADAGYQVIGFDHFAKAEDSLAIAAREGRLRRNFQGFTDESTHFVIGLGPSAISRYRDVLVQNDKHVGSYRMRVANGRLPGVRGVAISEDDYVRGALIERLLCDGTVDLDRFGWRSRPLAAPLDDLCQRGLLLIMDRCLTIAPHSRPYARLIASAFDAYRSGEQSRFSRAV